MKTRVARCITLFGFATLASQSGQVRADELAYGLLGAGSQLGMINLTTGAQTTLGSAGIYQSGLGVGPDGSLYANAQGNGCLLFLEDTTGGGHNTVVGGDIYSPYGAAQGLGSTADGTLYGLDAPGGLYFSLYSIDPVLGTSTLVGPTGLAVPTGGVFSPPAAWTLSNGSSTLYMTDSSNLYRLDTTTGAATLVGAMTDGAEINSMAFVDGTPYGNEIYPTLSIVTIDPNSAAVTPGPATDQAIYGLAPFPTPEPTGLSLPAVFGLAFVRTRSRAGAIKTDVQTRLPSYDSSESRRRS